MLLHPGLGCSRVTEVQNLGSISSQGTKSPCRTVTFAKASLPAAGKSQSLPCAELHTTDPTINTAINKHHIFTEKWENMKAAAMTQNNLETEDNNGGTTEATITKKRDSVQGIN